MKHKTRPCRQCRLRIKRTLCRQVWAKVAGEGFCKEDWVEAEEKQEGVV